MDFIPPRPMSEADLTISQQTVGHGLCRPYALLGDGFAPRCPDEGSSALVDRKGRRHGQHDLMSAMTANADNFLDAGTGGQRDAAE